MMKYALGVTLALVAAPALAGTPTEQGYRPGALGVSAILTGDYARAMTQLTAMEGATKHDPARLINLGNAYMGLGRYRDAQRAYLSALKSTDVDLLLANGEVQSSRTIAREALQRVPASYAAR